jgi:hypothetical protein
MRTGRMEPGTETDMVCPNDGHELTWHITGKDVPANDYENDSEIDIGRVAIKVCPKCHYYDESTMRAHFHGMPEGRVY